MKMTIEQAYEKGRQIGRGEHNESAPETRERLATLETNQKNVMVEIQELKKMILDLTAKVECALEKKADKEEVRQMQIDLNDLKTWRWKMVGIGVVFVAILYIIKDYIMGKL